MNNSSLLKLSVIALFTFKRPEHTRAMLGSLMKNPEFLDSPLFIYCDGARNEGEKHQVEETRKLVRNWPHPNKTIIERDRNWGLANSVIAGVTELCERFGKVIVIEDDLIVSPVFLNYMNTALEQYVDENKVMQISGHMFPVDLSCSTDAIFLPFITTWGWATWKRAWDKFDPMMLGYNRLSTDKLLRKKFDLDGSYPYFRMLLKQRRKDIDSWGILWNLSVFNNSGLVLYPVATQVDNEGFDGSGTHCIGKSKRKYKRNIMRVPIEKYPKIICVDKIIYKKIKYYLKKENKISTKIVNHLIYMFKERTLL